MSTFCWVCIFLGALLLWFTQLRKQGLLFSGFGYLIAFLTHQLGQPALLPIGLLVVAGYGSSKETQLPYRVAANVLFLLLALSCPAFIIPK
jgi:Na+/phosphate symporter